MITFISSPKPFKGITKENQYRAVRSWLLAGKNVEVILYGDSEGIVEAGKDLGVKVVDEINCSPSGIPYFGSIVKHAEDNGKYDLQVYLNCDILLSGILQAISRIDLPQFLLIGQRIDLSEKVFIDLNQNDWIKQLTSIVIEGKAKLHLPTGIDYFAFRRGMWQSVPPIIIGRGGYDNVLLAYCMMNRIPIVDATYDVIALHQFHGYDHMPSGIKGVIDGADAMHNLSHAGSTRSRTMVSDARYIIKNNLLLYCPCRGDRLRCLELKLRYEMGSAKLWLMLRMIWRLLQAFGITGLKEPSLSDILKVSFEKDQVSKSTI
ncbi:MAG: hypothetical protein J0665_20040 [Deltaproteobacteria bacterium]|jgi:hypothetical protein|nr:hypothetical protein [Deltaproteobacteria bacterium]